MDFFGFKDSIDKNRLARMEEKRKAKEIKNALADTGEIPFSKEADKDYFVELCAAEETIIRLRAMIAENKKEFDEYRQGRGISYRTEYFRPITFDTQAIQDTQPTFDNAQATLRGFSTSED